jgi:glycosyltransferase involved in cell wall biosynthesis
MRTLAGELGIADRVVLPGFVEDAAEALSALDVYLMPSRSEGLGMALIEAMACERSCVAMNSGGPGEILTDPSLGWLTPADDVAAFTRALLTAVDEDGAARAARGRRARAHVVARFDERRQTGRVAGLIESA